MNQRGRDELLAAAEALPADEAELLRGLHAFTAERLAAAQACRERLLEASRAGRDGAPELHAFLRESWEVLDGLAREVNLLMHAVYPAAGFYPPFDMTRQCTFYVVRKLLHESPATAAHPVADLLWRETREDGHPAYRRLSFLHNMGLFLPVAPTGGRLPGTADVPPAALPLIKPQQTDPCDLAVGTDEMLAWLAGLVRECYARLAVALAEEAISPRRHGEHGEGRRKDMEEQPLPHGLTAEELTEKIIGAAIEVHKALGPGLIESVYEECLCHELSERGLRFGRQIEVPVSYKGVKLSCGCRLDVVVEDEVMLELKAVETVMPVHEAQLLTYLRLSGKRVGLLLNFNVPVLKDGIRRRVL